MQSTSACVLFILLICSISASRTQDGECITDQPEGIKFPSSGRAILQFEFDTTEDPIIPNNSSFVKIIVVWATIDHKQQTIRIDVPNVAAIINADSLRSIQSPVLFTYLIRMKEKAVWLYSSVNGTNLECSKYTVPAWVEKLPKIQTFWDQFTYKGKENVNSFSAFKWNNQIPYLGGFSYFESCDEQRRPMQLQLTLNSEFSIAINRAVNYIEKLLTDQFDFYQMDQRLLFSPDMNSKLFAYMKRSHPETVSSSSVDNNSNNAEQKSVDREDDSLLNYVLANNYNENIDRPNILDDSTLNNNNNNNNNNEVNSDNKVEENGGFTGSEGFNTPHISIHPSVESYKFFTFRIAFLNWISTVVDQIIFVPPLFCDPNIAEPFNLNTTLSDARNAHANVNDTETQPNQDLSTQNAYLSLSKDQENAIDSDGSADVDSDVEV